MQAVSLTEVCEHIEDKFGVRISFDVTFADALSIEFNFSELSLNDLVDRLNSVGTFAIQKAADGYYIIKGQTAEYSLVLFESDSDQIIPRNEVTIFLNGKPVSTIYGTNESEVMLKAALHPRDTLQVYSYGFHEQSIPGALLLNNQRLEVKTGAQSDHSSRSHCYQLPGRWHKCQYAGAQSGY